MGKVIGIDLGTTNSCIAVVEGGIAKVIPNKEGSYTTPSVVAFTNKGERLVGSSAKRQAVTNPVYTFTSVKRHMGKDWKADVYGTEYTAPQISAMILQKLKKDAEDYLGCEIKDVVITVPAYFDDAQRSATKDAGKIAGLDVKRIINEPTSAALAYGFENCEDQNILVYDLGGGTFDVSIIGIGDGIVEVLATNGDTNLGGDDFDEMLINWIVRKCREKTGIDLSTDRSAMQRVKEEAEKAKQILSEISSTNINLPFIAADEKHPVHFETSLTRAEFENMVKPLVEKTVKPVKNAIADADLSIDEIDKVILVGGSTRMPCIQKKVKDLLGKQPSHNLNPDECVAIGAAIQGGKLSDDGGHNPDLLLLDVTPLSLSIETLGGVSTVLIERNTTIPTRKTRVFSTSEDNQDSVEIHVLQGERQFAKDNKTIGRFVLDNIPKEKKGVPQISVTFDIDANGIVKVSAMDMRTGNEQHITIQNSSGMTKSDINAAIDDAKRYSMEDAGRRKRMDVFNDCEAFLFQMERSVSKLQSNMDKDEMKSIKERMEKLKGFLKNDPDTIDDYSANQMSRLKEDIHARIQDEFEAFYNKEKEMALI